MDAFQNSGDEAFYRAFEDRYRGSRELIKSRLIVYLPFVEPLRQTYPDAAAIDLGCGRGEWLEVLEGAEFKPIGVDLDHGMLQACHELGLTVEQGDAIAYLSALPDESQVVVSGFHLAEHIPFAALQTLVAEALRVLQPGGLLILETPNPENVVVGTTNFYLDPTHRRPIPPLLLAFLPEHYGFERVRILRLQESPELAAKENIGLFEVFAGASPDYAIVAQKSAAPEVLHAFDAAFAKLHGIELNELANRYDVKLERSIATLDQRIGNAESQAGGMSDALARITALQDRLIDAVSQAERNAARAQAAEGKADAAESRATEAESRATEAESRATEAESEAILETTRKELHDVHQSNHHHWQLAEVRHQQIHALLNSISWRVTAPLRWLGALALKIPGVHLAHAISTDPVGHGIRFIANRPALTRLGLLLLKPFPNLESRVREKRAAQIRSDFISLGVNVSSRRTYPVHQQQDARDVLSLISASTTPLTADEILARIRRELDNVQVEK